MPPPSNGGFNKVVIYLGRGPTGWVWHGRAPSGDSSAGPGGIRTPRCSSPCLQRNQERIRRLFQKYTVWYEILGCYGNITPAKSWKRAATSTKNPLLERRKRQRSKGQTNVVHLKNSNGNKGREVLTPVDLFQSCHFLLELTYNQSVLYSVCRQYPRITESILESCSKHIEKVEYSNNINVQSLRSGLVLSLFSVGRSAAKTTNKPFRKSKSTNSPS